MTRTHTIVDSPLGELTLVAVDGALAGLYYPGHWYLPEPEAFGARSGRGFERAKAELSEYFARERIDCKDGKLTGYAGGLERKRFLLDLEAQDQLLQDMFMPQPPRRR